MKVIETITNWSKDVITFTVPPYPMIVKNHNNNVIVSVNGKRYTIPGYCSRGEFFRANQISETEM